MSESESDQDWDGAIDELLDRTDPDEELPDGARERMWESISASIDQGLESGENGSETDGGEGGGDGAAAADGAGRTVESSGEAGGLAQWFGGSGIGKTVATFLIGASAGAGGYAALDAALESDSRPQRAVSVEDTGTVDAAADAGADVDAAQEDAGLQATGGDTGLADARHSDTDADSERQPRSESTPPAAPGPSSADETNGHHERQPDASRRATDQQTDQQGTDGGETGAGLSGERLILSRAQAALGRGRPEEALDALEEHARQYPEGRLVEERAALEVRALAAAGRTDEAKQLARDFLEEHPQSIFQGQMRRILRTSADAGD